MLIECLFCHTEAQVPSNKEGAKVRCPECGKVFTARPKGSRARSSGGLEPVHIAIAIGAVVLLVVLYVIIKKGEEIPVAKAEEPETVEEPTEIVDLDISGWDSAPVQTVRELYELASAFDAGRVRGMLDGSRLASFLIERADPPEDEDLDPPNVSALSTVEVAGPWAELDTGERDALLAAAADALLGAKDENSPELWKPFDGEVVEYDDERVVAVVHLRVSPRAGDALESRTMAWSLAKDPATESWKIWAWERFLTEAERKSSRRRRQREVTQVTLSDGSKLLVADPRPLPHFEDTPEELRAEIDDAVARMVDFELRPPENSAALREAINFGKPALPVLLTKLYETEIVDDESAAKVNLIDQALQGITGEYFGFKPHETLGVTEERRDASLKAWFGWWIRRGEEHFEEKKEQTDALETLENEEGE